MFPLSILWLKNLCHPYTLLLYLLILWVLQAREGAVEVNATSSQVEDVVEETDRVVESATELALELQNRSRQLMYQARVNNNRSSANQEVRQRPNLLTFIDNVFCFRLQLDLLVNWRLSKQRLRPGTLSHRQSYKMPLILCQLPSNLLMPLAK